MNKDSFMQKTTSPICFIGSKNASNQMSKMIDQCLKTDTHLNQISSTQQSIAHKAGFVAEELHAESFNLDAILKDKEVCAFTDKYNNSPLGRNDKVSDIVIVRDGKTTHCAQAKYYKDAKNTANACRQMDKDGTSHYKEADSFITPADQTQGVKEHAHHDALKNQDKRPNVADAARQVEQKATDKLVDGSVKSKPLTKKDAEIVATNNDKAKGVHKKIQNEYKNASTLQQGVKAAGAAAVVTTVIAGTLNAISYLDKVRKGEIQMEEAVKGILINTAIAATDSAVKAGGATVVTSLATRALPELFKGSMLQSTLVGGAVAGATVCAIDLAQCLVLVAMGKMTMQEMETRTGTNIFQTGAGAVGAAIGMALGAPGGPIGIFIGGFVGGMITSTAMSVAIENHIEKPYKEIMQNTESLVMAKNIMNQSIRYIAQAEMMFEDFKIGLAMSEEAFDNNMRIIQSQRKLNWNKIKNLK